MATSTAVLLLPEETDDKAPPTACRAREKTSQGYNRITESACLFGTTYELLKNVHRVNSSRPMSGASNVGLKGKMETGKYIQ